MFRIAEVVHLGAQSACHDSVNHAQDVLHVIEREHVNYVVQLPTMVQILVDDPEAAGLDLCRWPSGPRCPAAVPAWCRDPRPRRAPCPFGQRTISQNIPAIEMYPRVNTMVRM
jgi:hypothetical protein